MSLNKEHKGSSSIGIACKGIINGPEDFLLNVEFKLKLLFFYHFRLITHLVPAKCPHSSNGLVVCLPECC